MAVDKVPLLDAASIITTASARPDTIRFRAKNCHGLAGVLFGYSLEKTKHFNGTYHVLGGVISPINGITPDQLHIHELAERISNDSVEEIIIATNASVEGESTALYIQNYLREKGFENLIISRLARGLPVGVDLEYADQITLSHALEGRKEI